jgi:hypothetical protein
MPADRRGAAFAVRICINSGKLPGAARAWEL